MLSSTAVGELPVQRVPVACSALLARLATAYAPQAAALGITLQVSVEPELPDVVADPERMIQALGNLVTSALRYTSSDGRIVLSARRKGTAIAIAVQDTGAGIAPDALPAFLEGPMHALRSYARARSEIEAARKPPSGLAGFSPSPIGPAGVSNPEEQPAIERARDLYQRVKASSLFDAKLGMYKTNAPLDACSPEIGRLRAFTPGWLENESIFLHMAYKYLLATLAAGLYDEFFTDMRRGLTPFFDPQTYGRSPLEHSSFIVSSAHPDAMLHGRGYVARLTGATAEFLSMWTLMMIGPQPFFMQDGKLCLAFKPTLPAWLFRPDGTLTFTFLGQCAVTYRRCASSAAYPQVTAVTLHLPMGHRLSRPGAVIGAPYAAMVRDGEIRQIELCLE